MRFPESMLLTCAKESACGGTVLLHRNQSAECVYYLQSGRVVLGLLAAQGGAMEHQLGEVQGPGWLDATAAVLDLPSAVDAMAQGDVTLRRVPLAKFRSAMGSCAPEAQALVLDIARAHRQQTELSTSRLAKDADARCAEWLLRHAESGDKGALCVRLQERKRLIAAQLGIAPETLSRVLRHLRERSLISGSGRVVNLVDPGGLRMLAGA